MNVPKSTMDDRSHNYRLILHILEGKRPEITEDAPEFHADLMNKCWNPKPENKSTTANEIRECFGVYNSEILELTESKHQEIIKCNKTGQSE